MQENKQEKSLIKRNILQYLECKGVTEYKFYKDSGVSRGVLSQNNGMSEDNITKFLAYAQDVNTTWLLTGIGPMLRTSDAATPAAPKVETSAAAPAAVRVASVENQPDAILALMDKISSMMEKIEGLARENGQLRERVNIMERERECMFVHSGGGKLPPPTPTSPPLSPQDLQSPVPSRDTLKSGRK